MLKAEDKIGDPGVWQQVMAEQKEMGFWGLSNIAWQAPLLTILKTLNDDVPIKQDDCAFVVRVVSATGDCACCQSPGDDVSGTCVTACIAAYLMW